MSVKTQAELRTDVAKLRTVGGKDAEEKDLKVFLTDILDTLFPSAVTGTVTDDDDAATNGTAVNVVQSDLVDQAHLESTTTNDANTSFEVGESGPTCQVKDNDAPGGVQLYFDEDATDADSKLMFVSPFNADTYLTLSNGQKVKVADNDDAATDGVAVYVIDESLTAHLRLLFVSPTDADATYTSATDR